MRVQLGFRRDYTPRVWALLVEVPSISKVMFSCTKPTPRQVRRFKKEVMRKYKMPKGYEMSGKGGWKNSDYPTFIQIGWTDETLIEYGYLRPIGAA